MAPTLKARPTIRAIYENCPHEADDPVFLLRNEHSVLLGKLRLLEQGEKNPGAVKGLLQSIIRDSEVHFKREAFLLRALDEKLEFGGRSFHRLIVAHEALLNMARELQNTGVRFRADSDGCDGGVQQSGEFARQFRDHIHHVEKVVYLLARTRLSRQHQEQLAKQILMV